MISTPDRGCACCVIRPEVSPGPDEVRHGPGVEQHREGALSQESELPSHATQITKDNGGGEEDTAAFTTSDHEEDLE